MSIPKCHLILVCAILCNCFVLFYISHVQSNFGEEINIVKALEGVGKVGSTNGRDGNRIDFESEVTIVILEFEEFENDLPRTIQSILDVLPKIHVLVVSQRRPYPPVDFPEGNVRLVIQEVSLDQKQSAGRPESYISTPYVLVVPDGAIFSSKVLPNAMLEELKGSLAQSQVKIIAVALDGQTTQCNNLKVDLKSWTLEYSFSDVESQSHSRTCDSVTPTAVVLLKSAFLHSLGSPYLRPFPQSLFVQSAIFHLKTKLLKKATFFKGSELFANPHSLWKHQNNVKSRTAEMYRRFGIKKVIQASGELEWYGCSKNTARCFGTVVDDMPSYIFESRWTPPCCLQNLRETSRYVFKILEKCNVKYWLEGGSLLGAARYGDIIPWDYDTDIGIYQHEIEKCEFLAKAKDMSITGSRFVDGLGYVWEKTHEGDFFRVQYSQFNHMHVDIFPFYEKNGIMTKDTWFKTHKQDTEFPAHYLQPLTKVNFLGVKASAPNNIREFLELKFGKGVIENPEYPNPAKLKQKSKKKATTSKGSSKKKD